MSSIIELDAKKTDSDFLMYSSDYCPYCIAAKRFFKSNKYK